MCGFHHCLNPAQGVKLPPIRRRVRQPLTFTEAHRLVEALPSPAREAALMSMLISADFAELAALRRRKVNLSAEPRTTDAGTIPPAAVLDCANFHEGKESTTETENRRRIVPLPPRLLEAIENYIAATPGGGPDALLFQNRRGGRIDRKDLYIRTLRPTAERVLGRSDGGWHTFWHCATTWAHWVSMPVAERVAIMNHARSKMTLLYTHTDSERRPPYVAELGSLILDYDGPPEHAPEAAARPAIEEFLRNYESPVIQ